MSESKFALKLKKWQLTQFFFKGLNELMLGCFWFTLGLAWEYDFNWWFFMFLFFGIGGISALIRFIYFPNITSETEQQAALEKLGFSKQEKIFLGIFYFCVVVMFVIIFIGRGDLDIVSLLLFGTAGLGSFFVVLKPRITKPLKIDLVILFLVVALMLLPISRKVRIIYPMFVLSLYSFQKGIKNFIQHVQLVRESRISPDSAA